MSSYRGHFGAGVETGRKFDIVVGRQRVTGPKKNTSNLETMMHLLKYYVGTGIFAMGDAFKNGGIVLGTVFLCLIAILNLYCQHQLVNAAKRVAAEEVIEVRPSFAETIEYIMESGPNFIRSYKKVIAKTTNGIIIVAEVAFSGVYFVFVGEHIQQVLKANGLSLNIYVILAIVLVPIWVSTFLGNLKMMFPLSLVANILVAITSAIIFYKTSIDLDNMGVIHLVADYRSFPLYMGTVFFAFEGIVMILPLRNEMSHPDDFDKPWGTMNQAMLIVSILYTSVGCMSYWKYGDDVKGSVFLNFAADDVLGQITKVLVSVAVMVGITVHTYITFEISYPLFHNKFGPFEYPFLITFLYRTLLVISAYSIANIVPNLGIFISLLGSLTIPFIAVMITPILDVTDREVGCGVMLRNMLIVLMGVLATVTGTYVSIVTAIEEFSESEV